MAYEFVAGVDIGLHLGQVSGISYEFDADWRLVLFPRSNAWSLGVNLFPLFAALYLRFLSRR